MGVGQESSHGTHLNECRENKDSDGEVVNVNIHGTHSMGKQSLHSDPFVNFLFVVIKKLVHSKAIGVI